MLFMPYIYSILSFNSLVMFLVKAYYTYSNALKNVRKRKSLNFILLFFLFVDRNCFI